MNSIGQMPALVLVFALTACTQVTPISRNQLAEHLEPILTIEKRADHVRYYTEVLTKLRHTSDENSDVLKAHHLVTIKFYPVFTPV